MITGAHILLYSDAAEADRVFFRDVLGFRAVDAGGGWLIFALPPAEVALHPTDGGSQRHAGHRMLGAVLYLMCNDLPDMIELLKGKGIACTEMEREPWGIRTTIRVPSGGELGLYQPTHPTALESPRGR